MRVENRSKAHTRENKLLNSSKKKSPPIQDAKKLTESLAKRIGREDREGWNPGMELQ